MKIIEQLEKKLSEIQNELDELKKQQSDRYPMELLYIGAWYCISTSTDRGELVRKYYIFAQLVETCNEWNRIDGFEPDWTDYDIDKFCICNVGNKISIEDFISVKRPICLKDKETAHLFLDTYRAELEQVKDLL